MRAGSLHEGCGLVIAANSPWRLASDAVLPTLAVGFFRRT
jgi:hypothetical protein